MQKKIQITLLHATDKEKSLEIDLRQELHLMITGIPDADRKMIFDAIREQLLAMQDTDVRKIDLTEENAKSQMRTIFQELENRYHTMAKLGMRTIEDYNQISANNWHYIVVLINYHPVTGDKIDDFICKLAQKGRAAGIHLILESSTTPPSRICFNFPTRFEMSGNEATLISYGKKCERRSLH